MTHSLVRWIGRRCLHWIYRERSFIGRERIPATGPVLLIGNHPNDIPDVLGGFLATTRPLRYVATVSGATTAASQAAYRGLGVIPVARVRDARKLRQEGRDAAALNEDAFRVVAEALREGAIVGVFPEGGVHDGPHLGHFRAGVSKMALEGTLDGTLSGLRIVAVGMQYEAARTPRSDLVIQIGEPFSVDEWLADATADLELAHGHPALTPERRAARLALALRDRMRDALQAVTRNAPTWELAESRDRLTAAVAAVAAHGARESGATGESLAARSVRVQQACAVVVESASSSDVALVARATELASAVQRAGGLGTSARDAARVCAAADVPGGEADAAWPSFVRLILIAPLAGLGWLVHGPLFAVIWRLARRLAKDRAELMARACVPGLYLTVAWYLMTGALLGAGLAVAGLPGRWVAMAVLFALALLPSLGDVAVCWRDDWRACLLRRRVRRWPDADRAALRSTADALRAAWTLRTSRDSSAFVKVAVDTAVDRTPSIETDRTTVAPATRTAS